MAFPKIIYNPGSGNVTLQFLRPARKVPYAWQTAERTDTISTAGVKQSILKRIDNFLEFEMEWIARGSAEGDAWVSFMAYALTGGPFSYYPDASQSANTTYTLEETDFNLAYKAPGQHTYKMKFRQVVT